MSLHDPGAGGQAGSQQKEQVEVIAHSDPV